jgi:hypothetical protein
VCSVVLNRDDLQVRLVEEKAQGSNVLRAEIFRRNNNALNRWERILTRKKLMPLIARHPVSDILPHLHCDNLEDPDLGKIVFQIVELSRQFVKVTEPVENQGGAVRE